MKKVIYLVLILFIVALICGVWDVFQVDRQYYLEKNSSITIPHVDLLDLPELPDLPDLPYIDLPDLP